MGHPSGKEWSYRKVKPENVPELIRRYEEGESDIKIYVDMPFKES